MSFLITSPATGKCQKQSSAALNRSDWDLTGRLARCMLGRRLTLCHACAQAHMSFIVFLVRCFIAANAPLSLMNVGVRYYCMQTNVNIDAGAIAGWFSGPCHKIFVGCRETLWMQKAEELKDKICLTMLEGQHRELTGVHLRSLHACLREVGRVFNSEIICCVLVDVFVCSDTARPVGITPCDLQPGLCAGKLCFGQATSFGWIRLCTQRRKWQI